MTPRPPGRFPPMSHPAGWLLGGVTLLLAWRFLVPQIADVARVYFFSEYVLKVVPFFTEAAGWGLLDTWALGDPRPRLVTLAAQLIDLNFRGAFPGVTATRCLPPCSQVMTPPAMGPPVLKL